MELELTEPLELELTCNGTPVAYELEDLTIRLVQPAFGIAQENAGIRGFPVGSLVFEAEGTVNEEPFASRRPNEQPVKMVATNGWVSIVGST
jgi:hypothetical protein